jgi:predicted chitinase
MKLFLLILGVALLSRECLSQNCQPRYGKDLTGTCINVDECTGGAFATTTCESKNHICCVNETASIVSAEDKIITRDLFLNIAQNTTRNNAMYAFFVEAMAKANISVFRDRFGNYPNVYRRAVFLSQLIGESDYFRKLESNTIDKDTDSSLGNNQTGDGSNFQGRGAVLLRGRQNYQQASVDLNTELGFDLMQSPERVAFPSVAFKVAAWVWKHSYLLESTEAPKRGDLNEFIDGTFHSFTLLTHSLTDNIQSLIDRAKLNDLILNELRYPSMKRGQGIECELDSKEKGYAVPMCLLDFNRPYCGCEGAYSKRSCPYRNNSTDKCPNSAVIKCCGEKFRNTLDLVVLMDSSSSMTNTSFEKQKKFVNSLIKNVSSIFQ